MNAAIDRDFDAHVERIRDFLRIPSVSAADGDLRSTAAAVCELIETAGGTAEVAEQFDLRRDAVRWRQSRRRRTLIGRYRDRSVCQVVRRVCGTRRGPEVRRYFRDRRESGDDL